MAVTEAISLNGRGHTFSMFGPTVHSMATYPEDSELRPVVPDQDTDVARRRRDLILPIVISNPKDLSDDGHTVLAVVVEDESGTDYTVDVYDSVGPKRLTPEQIAAVISKTGKPPPTPQVPDRMQNYVRAFIRKTRWWTDNTTTQRLPCGRFVVQYAATQTGGQLACGIHTILNAWAVALGLPINDANPRLARLGLAVEAVTYAAHGIIDCRTICQLLHHLRWVRPGAAPPRDRQFKRTVCFPAPQILNEYHADLWLAEEAERKFDYVPYEELDDCDQCTVQGHCYTPDGKASPARPAKPAKSARVGQEEAAC
ncbi:hypothetical protein IWX90DRAFT_488534 [Phyllosticta citrichinensis]|uniref:Ubiquitinyl hydrolase 1 n=1 Tax=Phyllosticta citrichinensis TaxID=1130410 RepID=A0ABR1XP94_9PEZI